MSNRLYYLDLFDTSEDGWNNNTLTILDDQDNILLDNITLLYSDTQGGINTKRYTFIVSSSIPQFKIRYNHIGFYPHENYYVLSDNNEEYVYASLFGEAPPSIQIIDNIYGSLISETIFSTTTTIPFNTNTSTITLPTITISPTLKTSTTTTTTTTSPAAATTSPAAATTSPAAATTSTTTTNISKIGTPTTTTKSIDINTKITTTASASTITTTIDKIVLTITPTDSGGGGGPGPQPRPETTTPPPQVIKIIQCKYVNENGLYSSDNLEYAIDIKFLDSEDNNYVGINSDGLTVPNGFVFKASTSYEGGKQSCYKILDLNHTVGAGTGAILASLYVTTGATLGRDNQNNYTVASLFPNGCSQCDPAVTTATPIEDPDGPIYANTGAACYMESEDGDILCANDLTKQQAAEKNKEYFYARWYPNSECYYPGIQPPSKGVKCTDTIISYIETKYIDENGLYPENEIRFAKDVLFYDQYNGWVGIKADDVKFPISLRFAAEKTGALIKQLKCYKIINTNFPPPLLLDDSNFGSLLASSKSVTLTRNDQNEYEVKSAPNNTCTLSTTPTPTPIVIEPKAPETTTTREYLPEAPTTYIEYHFIVDCCTNEKIYFKDMIRRNGNNIEYLDIDVILTGLEAITGKRGFAVGYKSPYSGIVGCGTYVSKGIPNRIPAIFLEIDNIYPETEGSTGCKDCADDTGIVCVTTPTPPAKETPRITTTTTTTLATLTTITPRLPPPPPATGTIAIYDFCTRQSYYAKELVTRDFGPNGSSMTLLPVSPEEILLQHPDGFGFAYERISTAWVNNLQCAKYIGRSEPEEGSNTKIYDQFIIRAFFYGDEETSPENQCAQSLQLNCTPSPQTPTPSEPTPTPTPSPTPTPPPFCEQFNIPNTFTSTFYGTGVFADEPPQIITFNRNGNIWEGSGIWSSCGASFIIRMECDEANKRFLYSMEVDCCENVVMTPPSSSTPLMGVADAEGFTGFSTSCNCPCGGPGGGGGVNKCEKDENCPACKKGTLFNPSSLTIPLVVAGAGANPSAIEFKVPLVNFNQDCRASAPSAYYSAPLARSGANAIPQYITFHNGQEEYTTGFRVSNIFVEIDTEQCQITASFTASIFYCGPNFGNNQGQDPNDFFLCPPEVYRENQRLENCECPNCNEFKDLRASN